MRLSRITAATDRQIAQHLTTRLLSYVIDLEGMRTAKAPVDDPDTWEAVCGALGIEVQNYKVPGGCPGEWSADIADGEPAVIAINRAYRAKRQASAFVHELAELLMFRMQPPLLMDLSDGGRYDDNRDGVLHRVARKVEPMVMRGTR